jgi:ppGpp synthetase/RelA/SpoT-type nucleotidyltranferase
MIPKGESVPISESVIVEAVARYDRERDRYIKLASRVADLCRSAVVEDNAIRAQVTSRTKTVKSFEGKLRRFSRRTDKNFGTVDAVFGQIGDFAGVRIATYRPEDETRVAEAIATLFCGSDGGPIDIDPKDKLKPAAGQFYRATHCQVHLSETDLVGNYENLRGASCEIQICSMMAHVWNEIEHDIGYKPEGEGPSDAELGLLEALGHLTRAGDAAITRLLAANIARMAVQTGDFADVHDFAARLRPHFPSADLSVNAGPAYEAATILNLTSAEKIEHATAGAAFNINDAGKAIQDFNAYLEQVGRPEFGLNRVSADLVLIALFKVGAPQIEAALAPNGRTSRPGRLHALARAYREYSQASQSERDAA